MRKIINVAQHRNGVGGNPFHVVQFKDKRQNMIAIVFDEPGNVAVFDAALLAAGVITFGENSWRGDEYELFLRTAVSQYSDKLHAAPDGQAIARIMQGGKAIWS